MAKTFTMQECADYLHIKRTKMLELARSGKIPGCKIGKVWVFLEEDAENYLRMQVQEQTSARGAWFEETGAGMSPPGKRRGFPAAVNAEPPPSGPLERSQAPAPPPPLRRRGRPRLPVSTPEELNAWLRSIGRPDLIENEK